MSRCYAKPYEGNEKFIFVSYSHKDNELVFPIIEELVEDGYRIWYDEGISPGSEWPEVIANHLNEASICLAFITENSLNSHNCRREINFALSKKKDLISVVLEPVQMSPGMEMQLLTSQLILKHKFPDVESFKRKLYDAEILKMCNNCVNPTAVDLYCDSNSDVENGEGLSEVTLATVAITESLVEHYIEKVNTDEIIEIFKNYFVVGRSKTRSDYAIVNNGCVGRVHAIFKVRDELCFIEDQNSLNKTYLNGKQLKPNVEYKLENYDEILIYNEKFIYKRIYKGI